MKTDSSEPEFLYKIVSADGWRRSQGKECLELGEMDDTFIHLATKEQLPRILEKFWPNDPGVVIVRLRVAKLKGRLVFENNPGGTTRYYHLYDGAIPMDAIVETSGR